MHNMCRLALILPTLVLSFFSLDLMGAQLDRKAMPLPLVFEENLGQAPLPYRFLSRQSGVESLFSNAGVDMLFPHGTGHSLIHFRFIGARPNSAPEGAEPVSSVSNYLLGNDPARWILAVPNQAQIVYSGIYPGVDLVFHGSGDQMEHDFRIAPGADPSLLRFAIDGAQKINLNPSGNLEIWLAGGKLIFQRPVAYQKSSRGEIPVQSAFVLNADRSVQFRLGTYDRNQELVIDPVFTFSTYLTGSIGNNITAVTSDLAGNVYVTGYTVSSDYPIVNGLQTAATGGPTAFVSKLDPTGHTLLYSTYLGGSSRNYGNAIAVDSKGNIVVAGTSGSNDFPHAGSVPALTCEGNNDCFFIASIKPDGSAFNYAGLIGGIEGTAVQTGGSGSGVLALDTKGNAYLAGVTDDSHFDITPGTLSTVVPGYPYNSSFVLKVASKGGLAYSTIIPGTAPQDITVPLNNVFIPNGIFIDATGQVTIAGTSGPGLPSTAGVIQPTFPNPPSENASAGFVLQINATASAINYATYVTGTDTIGGLAVDKVGNSYLTGGTSETNLPVSSNAYQKAIKAGQNCTCNSGFILKLNGSGTAVVAATYLEGTPASGNEGTSFSGIALDSHSNVFVGGSSASTDFPLADPFVSLWVYGESLGDMVLAEMNPDLSSLTFGSFLSSTDQTFPASEFSAIAVDHQDKLLVVGETLTTDFPTTQGSYQPTPPAQTRNNFVLKIDMATPAPSVCPDSWSIDFGQVAAGTSNTLVLHLKNCGNSALHLASIVSSAPSVAAKNSCGGIAAGTICQVSLTFAPKDSSLVTGTLTLNDDAVISPQMISFSGQGVAPQLSPSSDSFNFGHLLVNTSGSRNTLFFSNAGNAPLVFSSVSVDGDFSITQNLCKGTLQQGGYCFISIVFSPSAAGIRTGTLRIASNDPVYPRVGISLNGTGDAVYSTPLLTSLNSPTMQIKNGPVTVEVYGANFYPSSVIEINGTPQTTTYYSAGQLQAILDSTFTSADGEILVSVFNPAPGGGTSVGVPLTRYQVLNVDAAFLAYSPTSKLLYASIPSSAPAHPDTVIPINPTTGALGIPIPVGKNPGLLAVSSDGNYLFVAANQDQTVQRIDLSTKKVDRTFAFPPNSTTCCGSLSATDLKGIPGSPKEVVLSAQIPLYGYGETALYNDVGMVNYVPTSSSATLSFSSFAYAGDPLSIYALPFTNGSFFNVISIDSQGLHFTPSSYGFNNTTGAQVVSDGTLLYTSAGEVWNPSTQLQIGSFPVTTYNDTSYPNLYNLVMDSPSGHIFLIGDENYQVDSTSLVLSAYGQQSLSLTGALAFPQLTDPLVNSLVRWGTSGFAFLGQGNTPYVQAVYLLTSSLANPVNANPAPTLRSLAPSSSPKGSPEFQLTVNGQGFTEASVVYWNGAALPTTYLARTVLTALVPVTDLANAGSVPVTVANPAPGGGTSKALHFTVAPLAPIISFSSSALSFPPQKVGTSSTAHLIAVQNPGTATLTISKIALTGADANSFHQTHNCGATLAPGGNCTISIVFEPLSVGTITASVTVTDNSTGSPQMIALTGTSD
jgi:hypothetical protein